MDDKIFQQQFQSVMYRYMFQMVERLTSKLQESAADPQAQTGAGVSGMAGAQAETFYSALSQASGGTFAGLVDQASARYNVNPDLVNAVIRAESNFNPTAVSRAGASGLMQLMPATARSLGVTDVMDPAQNIDGGVRLLRQLLDRYDDNVQLALAAYNAGPGAVDRYQGIPPYRETQTYVSRVIGFFQSSRSWEG